MPIGYADDVRLRELTKAAKVRLDILTSKLGHVKREFEQAEAEYNDLVSQARRLGISHEIPQIILEHPERVFPKEKKKED